MIKIEWSEIVVRGNESGVKKTTCPNCSASRKKKKDTCLYVNFTSGIAKCYNCEGLAFRDSNEKPQERVYTMPPQQWQNYTKLSDNIVKWCRDERAIRQETLIHFGITEEKAYQPQKQKEVNSIVFNYFEGERLVNKKFRTADKAFTQSKGGKPIFYNINSIIGEDTVYIVEGEFDVLAMYEAGIKSCVSLPNGANDNDDFWKNSAEYLTDVKTFVIATDNDEKGIIVRDKIAQRLGRYKCKYLAFEHKDANGELINGNLNEATKALKRFPVSGTFTTSDMIDDIHALHRNGLPSTIGVKAKGWERFNDVFTVMRGHLVTCTGIPSHGKSTFTENIVIREVYDHDFKVSLFSPEHSPMELHQANLIQKATGKKFFSDSFGPAEITTADIDRYNNWSNERIYLTAAVNGEFPTWDWLLETFKEQMITFGIDVFVIDAFNKLGFKGGHGSKSEIDTVLTKLTMFAQMHNVIIFLVAHPTKMKKEDDGNYAVPTLYDVSGSADFRNQTHDGFCVHRYFPKNGEDGFTRFTNLKTKFSFQGEIGAHFDFSYHVPTGRYYPQGQRPDLTDYTRTDQYEEQTEFAIQPSDEFDMTPIDEAPF